MLLTKLQYLFWFWSFLIKVFLCPGISFRMSHCILIVTSLFPLIWGSYFIFFFFFFLTKYLGNIGLWLCRMSFTLSLIFDYNDLMGLGDEYLRSEVGQYFIRNDWNTRNERPMYCTEGVPQHSVWWSFEGSALFWLSVFNTKLHVFVVQGDKGSQWLAVSFFRTVQSLSEFLLPENLSHRATNSFHLVKGQALPNQNWKNGPHYSFLYFHEKDTFILQGPLCYLSSGTGFIPVSSNVFIKCFSSHNQFPRSLSPLLSYTHIIKGKLKCLLNCLGILLGNSS